VTRRGRLVPAALACFVVGAALLLILDQPVARAVGVLALLAFIVLGAFAIATPEYLGSGGDEGEARRLGGSPPSGGRGRPPPGG